MPLTNRETPMRRLPFRLVAVLLLVLATATPGWAQSGSATQVVERLHSALLDVMRNAGQLGYQGRAAQLDPLLREVFAYPQMSQVVSGRYWDSFSAEQRQQMIDTFARLSVATYANRFDGFSGETFFTSGEQEVRGSILVRTELIVPAGENVDLNYVVRQIGGQWRIIDVVLGGSLSELSRQRAEYTSVLGRGGFPALMTELQAAIARQGGGLQ